MALSGQKTVTTAGTAVALGSQVVNAALMVKALAANTGLVFVGNVAGDGEYEIVLNTVHSGFVTYDLPGSIVQ